MELYHSLDVELPKPLVFVGQGYKVVHEVAARADGTPGRDRETETERLKQRD